MGNIRVLLADQDAVFCQGVQEGLELEGSFKCVALDRSGEVLRQLRQVKPHILLLDVFLPPLGGLAVLKEVRARFDGAQLPVILTSPAQQEETLLRRASELGANYYLIKPFRLAVLITRIKQLLQDSAAPLRFDYDLKQVQGLCIRYFDLMGIPPHYKGYRYLLEGVWLACLHPQWLNSVTQKLYPAIGRRFNTSGAQVERAMRYALDITWERGSLEHLYRFFPYEIAASKGKPTNSAFIAKMADLVSLELGGF